MTEPLDSPQIPEPNDSPSSESLSPESDSPTLGLPKRLRGTTDVQDDVPMAAVSRARPDRQSRALELARVCARIAEDSRGRDILLLDVSNATPLVDYFVIATAGSRRQANAIASDIDAEMKRHNEAKLGLEGSEEGRWILIDYGDFVVHVFNEDARAHYALEDIWGDAESLDWTDPNRPSPPTTRGVTGPLTAEEQAVRADDEGDSSDEVELDDGDEN